MNGEDHNIDPETLLEFKKRVNLSDELITNSVAYLSATVKVILNTFNMSISLMQALGNEPTQEDAEVMFHNAIAVGVASLIEQGVWNAEVIPGIIEKAKVESFNRQYKSLVKAQPKVSKLDN